MPFDLDSAVASIKCIAEKYGGETRIELREAATEADIRRCEDGLGVALPPSHRQFLSTHNGVLLRAFSRRARTDVRSFALPTYKIDLFGTAEILDNARALEETFETAYVGDIPWLNARRARTFIPCADLHDGDERILLASDRPTGSEEYAVISVSLDSADWIAENTEHEAATRASMEKRGYPFQPAWVLAQTFGEFVERSLREMIDRERGFAYFDPSDENRWETR